MFITCLRRAHLNGPIGGNWICLFIHLIPRGKGHMCLNSLPVCTVKSIGTLTYYGKSLLHQMHIEIWSVDPAWYLFVLRVTFFQHSLDIYIVTAFCGKAPHNTLNIFSVKMLNGGKLLEVESKLVLDNCQSLVFRKAI